MASALSIAVPHPHTPRSPHSPQPATAATSPIVHPTGRPHLSLAISMSPRRPSPSSSLSASPSAPRHVLRNSGAPALMPSPRTHLPSAIAQQQHPSLPGIRDMLPDHLFHLAQSQAQAQARPSSSSSQPAAISSPVFTTSSPVAVIPAAPSLAPSQQLFPTQISSSITIDNGSHTSPSVTNAHPQSLPRLERPTVPLTATPATLIAPSEPDGGLKSFASGPSMTASLRMVRGLPNIRPTAPSSQEQMYVALQNRRRASPMDVDSIRWAADSLDEPDAVDGGVDEDGGDDDEPPSEGEDAVEDEELGYRYDPRYQRDHLGHYPHYANAEATRASQFEQRQQQHEFSRSLAHSSSMYHSTMASRHMHSTGGSASASSNIPSDPHHSRPLHTQHALSQVHPQHSIGIGESAGSAPSQRDSAAGGREGREGKRHVCRSCGKRFNRPSSLRIHMNTHTGAKPFICPYPGCAREFNVSSNMRRHYRNHAALGAVVSGLENREFRLGAVSGRGEHEAHGGGHVFVDEYGRPVGDEEARMGGGFPGGEAQREGTIRLGPAPGAYSESYGYVDERYSGDGCEYRASNEQRSRNGQHMHSRSFPQNSYVRDEGQPRLHSNLRPLHYPPMLAQGHSPALSNSTTADDAPARVSLPPLGSALGSNNMTSASTHSVKVNQRPRAHVGHRGHSLSFSSSYSGSSGGEVDDGRRIIRVEGYNRIEDADRQEATATLSHGHSYSYSGTMTTNSSMRRGDDMGIRPGHSYSHSHPNTSPRIMYGHEQIYNQSRSLEHSRAHSYSHSHSRSYSGSSSQAPSRRPGYGHSRHSSASSGHHPYLPLPVHLSQQSQQVSHPSADAITPLPTTLGHRRRITGGESGVPDGNDINVATGSTSPPSSFGRQRQRQERLGRHAHTRSAPESSMRAFVAGYHANEPVPPVPQQQSLRLPPIAHIATPHGTPMPVSHMRSGNEDYRDNVVVEPGVEVDEDGVPPGPPSRSVSPEASTGPSHAHSRTTGRHARTASAGVDATIPSLHRPVLPPILPRVEDDRMHVEDGNMSRMNPVPQGGRTSLQDDTDSGSSPLSYPCYTYPPPPPPPGYGSDGDNDVERRDGIDDRMRRTREINR